MSEQRYHHWRHFLSDEEKTELDRIERDIASIKDSQKANTATAKLRQELRGQRYRLQQRGAARQRSRSTYVQAS